MREFLRLLGVPLDDPELAGTPERAARAYRDELLDGYQGSVQAVLSESLPTRDSGLVVVTRIPYASLCPHHFLPSSGYADVGYLPGGRVVGLGVLVRLVNTLAHRLILQESLGMELADALVTHLGARASGVVLRARHGCLADRGERASDARVVTQSYAGQWSQDPVARAEFLHAVPTT